MNTALGYKTRTGLELPYEPQFVDIESYFHTWGTVHAFDALAAGPFQRDYSDARLLGELSTMPPDANLNFLNGWLSAHNLPSIADERIASPRDWLFAVRAYAQLIQEIRPICAGYWTMIHNALPSLTLSAPTWKRRFARSRRFPRPLRHRRRQTSAIRSCSQTCWLSTTASALQLQTRLQASRNQLCQRCASERAGSDRAIQCIWRPESDAELHNPGVCRYQLQRQKQRHWRRQAISRARSRI